LGVRHIERSEESREEWCVLVGLTKRANIKKAVVNNANPM